MIDAVLVVLFLASAYVGWVEGVTTVITSLVGLAAGALLGATAAPPLTPLVGSTLHLSGAVYETIASYAIIIILATVIQLAALFSVSKLRSLRREISPTTKRLLKGSGAAVSAATCWVAVWLVAAIGLSVAAPHVAPLTSQSALLAVIDKTMPPSRPVLHTMDTVGFGSGLPNGLEGPTIIAAPNPRTPAAVQARSLSVVKVETDQSSCNAASEGSGWVYAKDHIITNAHVVAAADKVVVGASDGSGKYPANVVYFDPEQDLAVLYSPGLPLPVAATGATLSAGDPATVVGFPEGGPYTETPARVRDIRTATQANIYGQGKTAQSIYALRAGIRHGNSGGPLFNRVGEVVGVVFGTSTTDPDTGYAFTLGQIETALHTSSLVPVSTGECTAAQRAAGGK